MGKEVDSSALVDLNRILRLAGGQMSPGTELDDGRLDQVIDVIPVVRRGLALPSTTGLFYCYLTNIHDVADDEESIENPYEIQGSHVVAPYPAPVPEDKDFWLLGASVLPSSLSPAPSSALLFLDPIAAEQGWGADSNAAGVLSNNAQFIARWDSTLSESGFIFMVTEAGDPYVTINRRIRRGTSIRFASTSTAAGNVQCVMLCALFQIGIGQDIVI